jgi:DHA2 family multidrug resistance protein-like MFS transporter
MNIPGDGLPVPARYRSMAVIILGISLSVLDSTIVNLALPGISRDLNASAAHSVWVINAYQLAILGLLLPCSLMGDLYGYRRVYLVGVTVFTTASAACLMADSLSTLVAARTVQGLGAAAIMGTNAALVRLTYPASLLGRAIALNAVVVAGASVAGPTVAAAILSVASWPYLFAINVPTGLAVLALGWYALPRNAHAPTQGAKLSWLDVALNALMFGLVFLGVDTLGARGGSSPALFGWAISVAMIACGVAIGVVFIRRQSRQSAPLFPVDLLRIPVFALSICTSICAFAAQMLSFIALPFLLLEGWGRNHLQAGLLLTVWPAAIVVAAPVAGRLIGRWPGGVLSSVGLAVMAVGLVLLAVLPAQPATSHIAWCMALCGVGFGMFQAPNNHMILTSGPLSRSGVAGGMLSTARTTGQSIGAVLLAIIFSFFNAHDRRGPIAALVLAACFAVAGSAFSLLRVRHTRKPY